MPALGYYLGAAFASILLLYGLVLCWRRRETALLAGLAAAALAYAAARVGGTPYTAAKAIEIGAPLAALVDRPAAAAPPGRLALPARRGRLLAAGVRQRAGRPDLLLAGLTGLRADVGEGPTLVLASTQLLDDEHGAPYIAWELRGGRVCIEPTGGSGRPAAAGVRFVVTEAAPHQPAVRRPARASASRRPTCSGKRTAPVAGRSPCPLIAVRQARQAAA